MSGQEAQLQKLEAALLRDEIAARRLPAAGPFHSGLMARIGERLTSVASRLTRREPRAPWISTLTGAAVTPAEASDPGYWARQAESPVLWTAAVASARGSLDVNAAWLEVGPGQTLTQLLRADAPPEELRVASLVSADEDASLAKATADLWHAGVAIDWVAAHAGTRRQRVALPTYPFQRQRYWLGQSAPTDAEPRSLFAREADPERWFYRPLWKQAQPLTQPSVQPGERWLLIGDGRGLGCELRDRLIDRGEHVELCEVGTPDLDQQPDPTRDQGTDALRDADSQLPFTRVVDLRGVTNLAEPQPPDAQVGERCFSDLLLFAQHLGDLAPDARPRVTVITNGAHAVTGVESLSPSKALVAGACRVIPLEGLAPACTHLDLDWRGESGLGAVSIDRLVLELLVGGDGTVAHRGAHRWVPAIEAVQMPPAEAGIARLRERGVYVVTGGLGGVGLSLAACLAEHVRARLVLLSRSGLPDRADWDALLGSGVDSRSARRIRSVRALEAAGAEVLILEVDVSREAEVTAAIEQARTRVGRIDGVIHAAGVAGDGMIVRRTPADADRVLAPKVAGTHALAHALLQGEAPDFVILCSSLTSILGGVGQADYCAANAFLDAHAQALWCAGDRRTIAIDWDTWREVGMAVETAVPAELAGVKAQALDAGLTVSEAQQVFLRALAFGAPQLTVSTKPLLPLIEATQKLPGQAASRFAQAATLSPQHPRPTLSGPFVPPATETERTICEAFGRALGVSGVGVDDNFFELGGHSLTAVQLMADLNRMLAANVPVAVLYDGLTARRVAPQFARQATVDDVRGERAERIRGRPRRPRGVTRRRDSRVERSEQ